MEHWLIVRKTRKWVPDWLWGLFCWHNLGARQPWRWLLTKDPDPFTKRRINGPE